MKVLAIAHVEQREQPALSASDNFFASDNWRAASCQTGAEIVLGPELDRRGLLGRALVALGSAHVLCLVIVAGIELALESGAGAGRT